MIKLEKISNKWARYQTTHPKGILAIAAVITVTAGIVASGLEFDSSYEALLPENAKKVENADRVRDRTGGTRQIVLAISGKNESSKIEFGRELAKRLRKVDKIRAVDFELEADFFRDRGLWLMDPQTLDDLIPAVKDAVEVAKWQANPMHLHLDEEAEKKELEAAWKKVDDIANKSGEKLPIDDILRSKDDKYMFMLVVPSIKFSDIDAGHRMLSSINKEVDALKPDEHGIEVRSAGNVDVLQEQHQIMSKDLRNASFLALAIGILVVATFTRKPITPFLIGAPLVAGIIWTFALARVFIGQVNIVTGFLVAVLIGLGIDFGVHIAVRYFQELGESPKDRREAVVNAVAGTLPPALTSAMTTAGTFLSFSIADFRGFSEFGLIAGIGTILTLVASFAILPPLLVIVYGAKPVPVPKSSTRIQGFTRIDKSPAIVLISIVGAVAVFGAFHLTDVPFRNNFKLLRGASPATEFQEYVDKNIGIGFNPAVFIANDERDARVITNKARKQKEEGQPNGRASRIGNVFSISDLLPNNPDEAKSRIQKLREILEDPKLDRAEKKEGERAKQLTQARKMVQAEPWGIDDIPKSIKRRMTTLDGKDSIVYIWPDEKNDADYQAAEWEDELTAFSNELTKGGVVHAMADETLLVAWIYRLILQDGPPLLIIAALVVLVFLVLDFRKVKPVLLVAFPLLVGMLMFAGGIHALGIELNMFNLIVVPSVIGIGIDNAVHIYHRYRDIGPGSIPFVIRTTGMAALLASLTTIVGFGSALISSQPGLRSMGTLAIIGISSTFIAATVFFPCVLTLLEKQKRT